MSAVYLAAHGRCCLLGATQQILTGSGPLPFQYAGSIGPLQLTQSQCATVAKVGEFIADRFGVRGLFGVDFVLSGDQLWTIEINPRYTASTEVLERSRGFSAIALLAAAWGKIPPFFQPNLANATNLCGKRIVYAGRERIVDEKMVQGLFERNLGRTWPQVADIPRAATRLLPGHPALTVFAEGQSQASLHAQLQTMQEEIRSEFVF